MITTRDRIVENIVEQKKREEYFRKHPEKDGQLYSNVMEDGAWKGRRCFIIGGGASLVGFDFERLRGEKVIATNRAFESCMFADILFFMDALNFHKWISTGKLGKKAQEKLQEFKGHKVYLSISRKRRISGVYMLKAVERTGLTFSLKQGLFHGSNSGYGALNLAVCLGANPIYLLGFDMKHQRDKSGIKTHFHEGYPQRHHNEKILKTYNVQFGKVAGLLKKRGIKVINLSMDSAMICFKKKPVDEVLQ